MNLFNSIMIFILIIMLILSFILVKNLYDIDYIIMQEKNCLL
jgi:hypothetical protein